MDTVDRIVLFDGRHDPTLPVSGMALQIHDLLLYQHSA